MQGSKERARAVINGEMPDRPPLYELLRNDAVINHLTGGTLTVENGPELVPKAYEPAVDATRPWVRTPNEEKTVTLEDGREQRHFRWTSWTEHKSYDSSEAYETAKRKELAEFDPAWSQEKQEAFKKLTGVGRLGKPEDIASMVVFLVSEEASFITMQNYAVCDLRNLGGPEAGAA